MSCETCQYNNDCDRKNYSDLAAACTIYLEDAKDAEIIRLREIEASANDVVTKMDILADYPEGTEAHTFYRCQLYAAIQQLKDLI